MLKVTIAVCALAVFLVPGLAMATSTAGPYSYSVPATLTDWSQDLAFPKFNPSLGTLQQVEVNLTEDIDTVLTVTNDASSPSSGNATTEVKLTLSGPWAANLAPVVDLFSDSYSYTNLQPMASITSGDINDSDSTDKIFTTSSVLSAFTGSGTISLPGSTFTRTWLANNGGNTDASQVTDADATGQVTYYYNSAPVPEPVTVTAVLLSLGALGAYVRRRAAAAK